MNHLSIPTGPQRDVSCYENDDNGVDRGPPAMKRVHEQSRNTSGVAKLAPSDAKPSNKQNGSFTIRQVSADLLNDFILDSLAYKSMRDREEEVAVSHGSTFEWIFNHDDDQDNSHRFTTWLSTDELGPIYWITGKPGSGKSTLTRFLFQHDSTLRLLRSWSPNQTVATAAFFFWTSGSREQRSQTGLLRALLHQLLSSYPEFIPLAFSELWATLRTMPTKERIKLQLEWTVSELLAAFEMFVEAAIPSMRICLFVDGLDEFEGSHIEIIDFFKKLAQKQNRQAIKMCLSSRPWAVFEEAFDQAIPNLRLQNLTYADMCRYLRDRLKQDRNLCQVLNHDPHAQDSFIKSTVHRADGVFLWVRLAANEILGRFKSGHGFSQLGEIVSSLPTNLDSLFAKLLLEDQSLEQVSQTAILFLLMRAREEISDFIKDESSSTLTVWELAFALKADDDQLALQSEISVADDDLMITRCSWTVHVVKERFAGLLELHRRRREGNMQELTLVDRDPAVVNAAILAEKRVTYTHRTVRDWLMQHEGVHDRLVAFAPVDFDPHVRLLRSCVLQFKRPLEEIEHHRRLEEWWKDICLAMTHARCSQQDVNHVQRHLLNELNKTLSWFWLRKPDDPYDHWARNAFGSYELRMKAPPIWQPFLCLATKFGLAAYVAEEVESHLANDEEAISAEQLSLETEDSTPLLAYATEFLCSRNNTVFPLSDPRLVHSLLRSPCRINPDPNLGYIDFLRNARTPWITLLRHLRDAHRRGWIRYYDTDPDGISRWAEIVRLFIEVGGADVDALVLGDQWDPEITAVGLIQLLEETYGAIELKHLRQLMAAKRGERIMDAAGK